MSMLTTIAVFSIGSAMLLLSSAGHRALTTAVAAALLIRAAAAIFHLYVFPLPDGTIDAVTFEAVAWEFAQQGPFVAALTFSRDSAYLYSLLMSVPYAVIGREPLLLQALSVLVGTWCVVLSWRLALELWGDAAAVRAAWVVALFPTLIMYSALTLREVYFTAFLLFGLIFLVRWLNEGRLSSTLFACAAFLLAAMFHTGALAAVAALLAIMTWRLGARLFSALYGGTLFIPGMLLIVGAISLFFFLVLSDPRIPKVGQFRSLLGPEVYLSVLEGRMLGGASYPEWMTPHDGWDLFWAIPLRVVYLLFSPFSWDVTEVRHIVGFLDGIFYAGLVSLMLANAGKIRRNPAAMGVVVVLVACLLVFGIGTGNFGTAVRHRAKILAVVAVLAGPYLARLVWARNAKQIVT